jgi:hypothetical protein
MSFGETRQQARGFTESVERRIELSLCDQCEAEPVVGFGEIRALRDGGAKLDDRTRRIFAAEQLNAAFVAALGRARSSGLRRRPRYGSLNRALRCSVGDEAWQRQPDEKEKSNLSSGAAAHGFHQ